MICLSRMILITNKTCFKCGAEKPLTAFRLNYKSCRACDSAAVRAHRKENIAAALESERLRRDSLSYKQYHKEYDASAKGLASNNRAKAAYVSRNPVKTKAKRDAGNAVRDGKLLKTPCEVCGELKTVGHHDDYSFPLTVRWLCHKHHASWHALHGAGLNG